MYGHLANGVGKRLEAVSPKAATVSFTAALSGMDKGKLFTRKEWKNLLAVTLIRPDDAQIEPLFIAVTSRETLVLGPLFTARDILTADWVEVQ